MSVWNNSIGRRLLHNITGDGKAFHIDDDLDLSGGHAGFGAPVTFKYPRHGDLVYASYLTLTLPRHITEADVIDFIFRSGLDVLMAGVDSESVAMQKLWYGMQYRNLRALHEELIMVVAVKTNN